MNACEGSKVFLILAHDHWLDLVHQHLALPTRFEHLSDLLIRGAFTDAFDVNRCGKAIRVFSHDIVLNMLQQKDTCILFSSFNLSNHRN